MTLAGNIKCRHQSANRPGNRGRNILCMYMRHWTCGSIKRVRSTLQKLPWECGQGRALPLTSATKKRVTEDRILPDT